MDFSPVDLLRRASDGLLASVGLPTRQQREQVAFERRVESLQAKLPLTEEMVVDFLSASPQFLTFSRLLKGQHAMPERAAYGSIAVLARRELTAMMIEADLNESRINLAGNALGFSPEQCAAVLAHNKLRSAHLSGSLPPVPLEYRRAAHEGARIPDATTRDELLSRLAIADFARLYPNRPFHITFSIGLALDSKCSRYDVRIDICGERFFLPDPVDHKNITTFIERGLERATGVTRREPEVEAAAFSEGADGGRSSLGFFPFVPGEGTMPRRF